MKKYLEYAIGILGIIIAGIGGAIIYTIITH